MKNFNFPDEYDWMVISFVVFFALLFMLIVTDMRNEEKLQKNRIISTCLTKADTVEKIAACKDLFKK